jgi:hypothetical protein
MTTGIGAGRSCGGLPRGRAAARSRQAPPDSAPARHRARRPGRPWPAETTAAGICAAMARGKGQRVKPSAAAHWPDLPGGPDNRCPIGMRPRPVATIGYVLTTTESNYQPFRAILVALSPDARRCHAGPENPEGAGVAGARAGRASPDECPCPAKFSSACMKAGRFVDFAFGPDPESFEVDLSDVISSLPGAGIGERCLPGGRQAAQSRRAKHEP